MNGSVVDVVSSSTPSSASLITSPAFDLNDSDLFKYFINEEELGVGGMNMGFGSIPSLPLPLPPSDLFGSVLLTDRESPTDPTLDLSSPEVVDSYLVPPLLEPSLLTSPNSSCSGDDSGSDSCPHPTSSKTRMDVTKDNKKQNNPSPVSRKKKNCSQNGRQLQKLQKQLNSPLVHVEDYKEEDLSPSFLGSQDELPPLDLATADLSKLSSKTLETYAQVLASQRKLTHEEERNLKRQRRLIKNRESAQLSRMRKKLYIDDLERKVANLNAQNSLLSQKLATISIDNNKLREEVDYLQGIIKQNPTLSASLAQDVTRENITGKHCPNCNSNKIISNNARAAGVCLLIVLLSFGLMFNSRENYRTSRISSGSFPTNLITPPSVISTSSSRKEGSEDEKRVVEKKVEGKETQKEEKTSVDVYCAEKPTSQSPAIVACSSPVSSLGKRKRDHIDSQSLDNKGVSDQFQIDDVGELPSKRPKTEQTDMFNEETEVLGGSSLQLLTDTEDDSQTFTTVLTPELFNLLPRSGVGVTYQLITMNIWL